MTGQWSPTIALWRVWWFGQHWRATGCEECFWRMVRGG